MAAKHGEQHHLAKRTAAEVRRAVNLVRILKRSRRSVAAEMGVHWTTVARWVRGERR